MSVQILSRERAGTGWYRYTGVVHGVKVGVRLPASYVFAVSDADADAEVKECLQDEYERLHRGDGGAFLR